MSFELESSHPGCRPPLVSGRTRRPSRRPSRRVEETQAAILLVSSDRRGWTETEPSLAGLRRGGRPSLFIVKRHAWRWIPDFQERYW